MSRAAPVAGRLPWPRVAVVVLGEQCAVVGPLGQASGALGQLPALLRQARARGPAVLVTPLDLTLEGYTRPNELLDAVLAADSDRHHDRRGGVIESSQDGLERRLVQAVFAQPALLARFRGTGVRPVVALSPETAALRSEAAPALALLMLDDTAGRYALAAAGQGLVGPQKATPATLADDLGDRISSLMGQLKLTHLPATLIGVDDAIAADLDSLGLPATTVSLSTLATRALGASVSGQPLTDLHVVLTPPRAPSPYRTLLAAAGLCAALSVGLIAATGGLQGQADTLTRATTALQPQLDAVTRLTAANDARETLVRTIGELETGRRVVTTDLLRVTGRLAEAGRPGRLLSLTGPNPAGNRLAFDNQAVRAVYSLTLVTPSRQQAEQAIQALSERGLAGSPQTLTCSPERCTLALDVGLVDPDAPERAPGTLQPVTVGP